MIGPQEVSDRLEIIDVLILYATAIDQKNWQLLEGVFVPGADCDYEPVGGVRDSYPEICDWLSVAMAGCESQHILSNYTVAVDGDSATTQTYLQAQHIRMTDGISTYLTFGGIYADELVRTEDGWRIRHRVLTRQWQISGPTRDA